MKNIFPISALVILTIMRKASASIAEYDLVIIICRIMDPETNCGEIAKVGIKKGIIAAISHKTIKGKQTIDATGHVVAPGFIDSHAHGQNTGY